MPDRQVSGDSIERLAREWYDRDIRSKVEVDANIGKLIVIDASTGDYEIGEDGLVAGRRLQKRRPAAAMLCLRIGYDAVYS
jgi:hypothetical protein